MMHAIEPLIWRKGFGPKQASNPEILHYQLRLAMQFAELAACSNDLQTLQHEICRVAAEGLRVTFAKLLVYQEDERAFVLQAGVGWRKDIIGTARLDADAGTAAGFAWLSKQPIISNDLVYERRFRVPTLLAEYKIIRCINVVVLGSPEEAYGVLEVESPEPGHFTESDVSFLQLLTQNLASAMDRISVQEKVAQSILEHGLLLHELQHRVRNDLQVIYSVLVTEARKTADPLERTGFDRVSRRVMALGGLYDHLLGLSGTDKVDMGAYLQSLCGKIATAADLPSRAITLEVDTDYLKMAPDHAVRLAVVINELVTNAVEHAFPERTSGRIIVTLRAKGADGTGPPVVTVMDDGCGFQGPRPGSSGLTFVERLTHQAGAVLDREDGGGTRWNIRLSS